MLEQTIAPHRVVEKILTEERARGPDWHEDEAADSWRPLAAREEVEWPLADAILCGSRHVVDTVAETGSDVRHCQVVPYGRELPSHEAEPSQSA